MIKSGYGGIETRMFDSSHGTCVGACCMVGQGVELELGFSTAFLKIQSLPS